MGKVIVEQIVSADGFAEDGEGGIGFFSQASWINEVDVDQLRMLAGAAAIVLGANTYRMSADYWPHADPVAELVAVPIRELPKFVISSTLASAPWGKDAAEVLSGDGVVAIRRLRQRFTGDLVIWGSLSLSDALLRAGEIDVLRLRVIPVLLGRGRSFAPPDIGLRPLTLLRAQSYERGILVLEYRP